jgi:large subunit ribosomal protein L25
MSGDIVIHAVNRTTTGSSNARRLRHDGRFPGVLYSQGNVGVNVAINEHEYEMKLKGHPSENLILDLDLEGTTHKVLLREVQHNPLTGRILHVDFNEVAKGQKLRVPVTVELVGEAEGVKAGGVLETLVHNVDVECIPSNLPEKIIFDVSHLQIGDHASVADLDLDPSKVTVLTPGDVAIANVAAPRVATAEEVAEEAGESGEDQTAASADAEASAEG